MASSEESQARIIATVIEKFNGNDDQVCVACITGLPAIGTQLGLDYTQNVLLPLIQSSQFQNPAIVIPLLDCITQLKSVVGGAEEAHRFVPIIEDFYKIDSTEVAVKALECLKSLFKDASQRTLTDHFVPFVKRLSNDHWPLTRAQSCALFALCYSRVAKDTKQDLIRQFAASCEDNIPCVRMEVARHLGELAKATEFEGLTDDIVPVFIKLASDEHESVRHLLIDTFFGISTRFIPRNVEQYLMPTMRKLFSDKSYLVRHRIATRFIELQKAVGTGITKSDLLPIMVSLLQDSCPEVRVPAILKIIDFWEHSTAASTCEKQLVDDILPALITQALHPCQQVRIALCNIVNLSKVLGQRVKEHLLPVLTTLIQDVSHQVRFTVVTSISRMEDLTEIKNISADLANIIEEQIRAADNVQARAAGQRVITRLAQTLGQGLFNETLTGTYLMQFVDPDVVIREIALFHFDKLLKCFGNEWITQNLALFVVEKAAGYDESISTLITWLLNCLVGGGHSTFVLTKEIFPLVIQTCEAEEDLRTTFENLLIRLETTCDDSLRSDVSSCLKAITDKRPHTVQPIITEPQNEDNFSQTDVEVKYEKDVEKNDTVRAEELTTEKAGLEVKDERVDENNFTNAEISEAKPSKTDDEVNYEKDNGKYAKNEEDAASEVAQENVEVFSSIADSQVVSSKKNETDENSIKVTDEIPEKTDAEQNKERDNENDLTNKEDQDSGNGDERTKKHVIKPDDLLSAVGEI